MRRLKNAAHGALAAFALAAMAASFSSSPASAQALPSFDCAKSQNAIEKLICGNSGLAALDVETTRLFDLAKAGDGGGELLLSQREWLGRRNDCASSTDKQRCVAESYVQRISQLRERYPVTRKRDSEGISLGPFNAICRDFSEQVTVTFVNSNPAYAFVGWSLNSVVLKQAMSGSGALYEAQYPKGQSRLWNKGNNAQIALPGGKDMSCALKPMG